MRQSRRQTTPAPLSFNQLSAHSASILVTRWSDGEGATKYIAITVNDSMDDRSAREIAFSIVNSPLF
jgi:N-acetylglutamate synthase/N-acetylornithine aminotransferase